MSAAWEKIQKLKLEGQFRSWITADGSSGVKAEADRFHMYISLGCPFASRAYAVLCMKGLEDVIPVSVVYWSRDLELGWDFRPGEHRCTEDVLHHKKYLKDIYLMANPNYSDRVTVPLLWDKQAGTAVSNESLDLMHMFNSEFNEFCKTDEQRSLDLYPADFREEIDSMVDWLKTNVNVGVYRAGFADTQEVYGKAATAVFEGLDKLEETLSKQRYLIGGRLTICDVCLFVTLVRFDMAYHGYFKLNKKRIVDYPNLWAFTRDLYQRPAIQKTVDFIHIKRGYYETHKKINPSGIVPIGPDLHFTEPHNRARLP